MQGLRRGGSPGYKEGGERGTHKKTHKNVSPKPLSGKTTGAEFLEFLQPARIKAWSFQGQRAGLGYSLEGAALSLEKRQANNPETDSVSSVETVI